MTDVNENKEIDQQETPAVDVPSGETTEATHPDVDETTQEIDKREQLAQNLLKFIGAVAHISSAPSRPTAQVRNELKDIFKHYRTAFEDIFGQDSISDVQEAWLTDLSTLTAEVPELINSLNLATFITERAEPSLQRLNEQTHWMACLRQRQEGVHYLPIKLSVEDEGAVKPGSEKCLQQLVKTFRLCASVASLEDISGSEKMSEFFLPIFVNLVYPPFALLLSEEHPLNHYFNTPAFRLPLYSEKYQEYCHGEDETNSSALEELLRKRQADATEEPKKQDAVAIVNETYTINKEGEKEATLSRLTEEGEWVDIDVSEEDDIQQRCLASVIAEFIEIDPEEGAIFTVKTEDISLERAIREVRTVKSEITSTNHPEEVTITFFNYN